MEIGVLYAIMGSVIWGSMFALSKNVKTSQIFQNIYITFGGFIIALIISISMNTVITNTVILAGLTSGALWAFASLSFLYSMKYIGIGRAFPISVSGQIIVSFLWGALFFGEIISSGLLNFLIALAAIFLICISALLLSKTNENIDAKDFKKGLIAALLSSVFWGTQFVPVKFVSADSFAVMLPFAAGMLITACLIAFVKFGKKIDFFYSGKVMNLLNGFMWAFGNYLILFAVASIGLAKGFVLSQVGIVIIPPLLGVFYFKEITEKKNYLFIFLAAIFLVIGTILITIVK